MTIPAPLSKEEYCKSFNLFGTPPSDEQYEAYLRQYDENTKELFEEWNREQVEDCKERANKYFSDPEELELSFLEVKEHRSFMLLLMLESFLDKLGHYKEELREEYDKIKQLLIDFSKKYPNDVQYLSDKTKALIK